MAKPTILTVDDDPEVLRAVERDLRREYARDYRVLRAESGEQALDTLRQLKLRADPVALLLVDQRMPKMSGVEFLEQAKLTFPDAKRVLLTAYADTDAAIKAINDVDLDYYLMKPWDPPDQKLYPVLTDMLEDWKAGYRPPFQGIRVIGHQWSPRSHDLKDFLSRNQAPYQWLDYDTSEEAKRLLGGSDSYALQLPLVILPDGTQLREPAPAQLAEAIGLQTKANSPYYDLVIVGGGPAGLASAVYGASEGLKTLLIERNAPGGQAGTSSRIENYLGFPSGVSGADLARRATDQARRFGVEVLIVQDVCGVRVEEPYKVVELAGGEQVSCKALVISTGVSWRKLRQPGVERLTGAGVYYGAAITEAISCTDDDVFVVGGANSAGQAAVYLAKFARSVTILVRSGGLEKAMSQYLIDEIRETPNIAVRDNSRVLEVRGKERLEEVLVEEHTTGVPHIRTFPASALFIMIGAEPYTDWLDGVVARDPKGFVLAGPDLMPDHKRPKGWKPDRDPFLLETSTPGVFVAGDVRRGSVKRVASAVGEGSIAVQFIHQYLAEV